MEEQETKEVEKMDFVALSDKGYHILLCVLKHVTKSDTEYYDFYMLNNNGEICPVNHLVSDLGYDLNKKNHIVLSGWNCDRIDTLIKMIHTVAGKQIVSGYYLL